MNIFQEAKQILDKDGKVNPLGPYGKQKLTGQEVAQYFRKNKVSDSKIKKAVEVALDLGGAMDIATKEIKKFYGDKILKSKEVQGALKFANEETVNEIFGFSQDPRYRAKVMKMLDDEGIKYKKDGRNALIILGVAPKDQKKLLDRIHKEFGMTSYNIIDEEYVNEETVSEKFKPYMPKGYERVTDLYVQFRGDEKQSKKDFEQAKKIVSAYSKKHKLDIKDHPRNQVFGSPEQGSSAYKVSIFAKFTKDENHDLSPLYQQLSKLKTAEDHGGGYAKPIKEETITEGKNLVPAVKKIVDTKGAAKVGGVMIDMFTASMISQIYDKVNDQNKKKMENSNIQTLVGLAQRMMQKNSVEEGANPAQQAAIAISKKEKAGKPGYDKEGKSLKKESVMDAYRKMWEDASDIVEVTDKEINAMKQLSKDAEKIKKNYQKIVNMGDKELRDKKYNKEYEDILKMSQSVLSLIGKLQTQKIINKESLEEKLNKQDLKFIDMMYDKKGNLTDVGKAVMNYKPGDNIRKIVQNLNNKK